MIQSEFNKRNIRTPITTSFFRSFNDIKLIIWSRTKTFMRPEDSLTCSQNHEMQHILSKFCPFHRLMRRCIIQLPKPRLWKCHLLANPFDRNVWIYHFPKACYRTSICAGSYESTSVLAFVLNAHLQHLNTCEEEGKAVFIFHRNCLLQAGVG